MSFHYDGVNSANDRIDLMVSLLVRYPEINTIKTDPKAGEIIFSFLLKKELAEGEFLTLQQEFEDNIETFLFIQNRQPLALKVDLQAYEGYSLVEVIRDFQTISQREISLLIQLVHNELGVHLLAELGGDTLELEDLEMQEEMIEDLLDRLQYETFDESDMIGYREAGKVMVFQKTPA